MTAKRYYSRFDTKMVLQKRSLKKSHPDHHYGAKTLKNLKEMACKFNGISTVVMMDDKAAIPVGPPGAPVSATRRQRAVLQTGASQINCTDHDHVAQHLTPSVSVTMDAPNTISSQSWYGRVPEVILKCAIFEPSNAFRHATEISRRLVHQAKPLLFGITDGGPDHNTTHIQVQLSLVPLFLCLDVDLLCFARTPPNYSVLNPVERIMCVINIALNGMALCRTSLDSYENLVKNLCSKTA